MIVNSILNKKSSYVYSHSIYSALIFLFLVFSLPKSNAQAFTHFNTSNSGIPENLVHCITIDNNGTKWVGTDFGLATFDDVNWTVYSTFNSGLPNNSVRCIYIDSNHVKWIGTLDGGLTRFDGTNWQSYNTFNSNICNDLINDIKPDSAGDLWLATLNGLSHFKNNTFINYQKGNYPFLTDHFSKIYVNPDDSKILCTINGGLVTMTDTTFEVYTSFFNNFPDNSQLDIVRDQNGIYWMAAVYGGLIAYFGVNNWTTYNSTTSAIPFDGLSGLQFDNAGKLWIATGGDGIILKQGIQFTEYNISNSAIGDNYINDITLDSTGNLWLCSASEGLIKVNPLALTLKEDAQKETIKLFPNPARNYVYINSKLAIQNISITNIDGNQIDSIPFNFNDAIAKIDLSNYKPGIYFFKLTMQSGEVLYKKIIKN